MKKIKIIILSILIVILLAVVGILGFAGNYLYTLALDPNSDKSLVFGDDEEEQSQEETSGQLVKSDEDWLLEDSNYEDLYLTSEDNLKLHNYLIDNNSNKWVIPVHGYTSQGKYVASYAKWFYDEGFNVLIPDLRSHGLSEGDYIGMGWDERKDILQLIDYIVNKDKDAQIVLFGVSMGAATVMNVAGEPLPSNVKAIIEDCGYTSAWNQFSYQLKTIFNLPSFPMMDVANIFAKFKAGYNLKDASPIDSVKKATVPMLFIHGDEDDFVPYEMQKELYDACSSENKELIVIKGAGHAKSNSINPEDYYGAIKSFLSPLLK